MEIKRQGKSYTINTLRALRDTYPQVKKFFFIVGTDAISYLDSWKDIDEVMKLAKFVVASRPNYPLKNLPKNILPLAIEPVDISGYRLRQRLEAQIAGGIVGLGRGIVASMVLVGLLAATPSGELLKRDINASLLGKPLLEWERQSIRLFPSLPPIGPDRKI